MRCLSLGLGCNLQMWAARGREKGVVLSGEAVLDKTRGRVCGGGRESDDGGGAEHPRENGL